MASLLLPPSKERLETLLIVLQCTRAFLPTNHPNNRSNTSKEIKWKLLFFRFSHNACYGYDDALFRSTYKGLLTPAAGNLYQIGMAISLFLGWSPQLKCACSHKRRSSQKSPHSVSGKSRRKTGPSKSDTSSGRPFKPGFSFSLILLFFLSLSFGLNLKGISSKYFILWLAAQMLLPGALSTKLRFSFSVLYHHLRFQDSPLYLLRFLFEMHFPCWPN